MMTPDRFNKELADLVAANPKGVPIDKYLSVMVKLIQESITAACGAPSHVTLFVGAHIEEAKTCSTLSDDQLLLMLMGVCERMALKHAPVRAPGGVKGSNQ